VLCERFLYQCVVADVRGLEGLLMGNAPGGVVALDSRPHHIVDSVAALASEAGAHASARHRHLGVYQMLRVHHVGLL